MLALQGDPSVDPRELVQSLIKIFVVLFFVALPILRGVKEWLAKKALTGEPKREADEAQRAGKRAWEELLRGETAEETTEVAPQPPPPPMPRPVARTPQPPPPIPNAEGTERSSPLFAGLGAPTVAKEESSESGLPDEEDVVERELEWRRREARERELESIRVRERPSATPSGEDRRVGSEPSGDDRRLGSAPSGEDRRAGTERSDGAPGGAQRAASERAPRKRAAGARGRWREAIVSNEVLGPPVCERGPFDRTRPAALRR